MDGTGGYCAEKNQTEKDKYNMISLICGIYKTKQNKTETVS